MHVPITYLPHHSWCSLSKWFFKYESKGTSGDSHYVYEHMNIRTHVKPVHSHTDRGIRTVRCSEHRVVACRSVHVAARLFSAASQSPYGRDGRRTSFLFACTASFFATSQSCPSRATQSRTRSLRHTLAYAPLA